MYNLSSSFNAFYSSNVVLPKVAQNELFNKSNINIQRLKEGLKEYNDENRTSYSIVEQCVQGSVAMCTVVQNENSDYDIDVAIVFSKDSLGDKGAQATRNMVADALKRKAKQFKAEPEIKTSSVRVKYADGYHIDFAIFRRYYDKLNGCWIYEHAGVDWTKRDLRGLTEWFETQNNTSAGKLRKVVRLSKMFCKSRNDWKNMPSGLLQTILCDNKLQNTYERLDELFYYTMKEVVDRLETDISVVAPIDGGRNLTPRESDKKKMINWKNRLKSKLEDLNILFEDTCTKNDAIQAWYGFFNHDFWNEEVDEPSGNLSKQVVKSVHAFTDTEQFIEDLYPVNLVCCCNVSCNVIGDGWKLTPLSKVLAMLKYYLPHNFEIRCKITSTDCLQPYTAFWKIKNVGPQAERRDELRGQIVDRGTSIVEHSDFFGKHYIECYIIKNGVCVAKNRIDIPIGRG